MVAPLDGIRVLEVANWIAAPSCAALMADMGADVIKVEPPGGEAFRHTIGRTSEPGTAYATSWAFELDNRGKRSITVDLTTPAGCELVRRLAGSADVFITNLVQRRRVRYGLTAEDVLEINPRIIYGSLSGYGIEGPDAERAAFDTSAFWARSGVQNLLGEPDAPPPPCRSGQGDHTTALNLLASVLAGLRLRDMTGKGQVVDVTLIGTGVWTIASDVSVALQTREQPGRHDRTSPPNPLRNTYRCRDGRWLTLIMAQPDPYWIPFSQALGRADWLTDPRYETMTARAVNTVTFTAELDAVFATEDLATWTQRLDAAELIWAPVSELPDVVEDEALRGLGAFTSVDHPGLGAYETLSAPFSIRGAEVYARGPAPSPGADTASILEEHGLDPEEIASLAAQGVFG